MAPTTKPAVKKIRKRRSEAERLRNPDGRRSEIDLLKDRVFELNRELSGVEISKTSEIENFAKWVEDSKSTVKALQEEAKTLVKDKKMQTRIVDRMISHLKQRTVITTKNERNTRRKILDLDSELVQIKADTNQQMNEKALARERMTKTEAREEMLKAQKEIRLKQETIAGEPKLWRLCQICHEEYSDEGSHIPRILECGHTLCVGCIESIKSAEQIIDCPFDRRSTDLQLPDELPTNLIALGL